MAATTRVKKGVVIVHPDAVRVTASSGADEVRTLIFHVIESGHLVIAIDFTGVEYIDNTMIGVLVETFKKLHPDGGTLCVFGAGDALQELFRATVIDQIVEIASDEQAALKLLEDRPRSKLKRLLDFFS